MRICILYNYNELSGDVCLERIKGGVFTLNSNQKPLVEKTTHTHPFKGLCGSGKRWHSQ